MSDRDGALITSTADSPIGPLLMGEAGGSLCLLKYADQPRSDRQLLRVSRRLGVEPRPGTSPVIEQTREELSEFFAGDREGFTAPIGLWGTPFQRSVWAQLLKIPFGETRSYAQIAHAISDPTATRAVGTANGANPISILVPCHRVVRTGGVLGGYGGGLDRKRWLLDHERATSGATLFA